MAEVLLAAATKIELCDHEGLACGIGPVDAAANVARSLAVRDVSAVIHVGIAGGRGIAAGSLVVGTESIYCDLSAAIPVTDRLGPDERLLAAARAALPDALALPIGTSAAVGGTDSGLRVEAMEGFGVLRACAQAGVPAIEVRAISNEVGEDDRSRWQIGSALESLATAIPSLLAAVAK
jgi:futalosine hydrolase